MPFHQAEEPAPGEQHPQREIDGDEEEDGVEHAGRDLHHAGIGPAPVDIRHDVHQGPEGGGGGEQRHGDARRQHGVGLAARLGEIGDIVGEDGQTLPGDDFGSGVHQGVDVDVEQPHKGVDADQDGEKGEDEEIGQLGGRPGHPAGKIDVGDLTDEPHGGGFPKRLHGSTCLLDGLAW